MPSIGFIIYPTAAICQVPHMQLKNLTTIVFWAPIFFVPLWATGFVGSKYGLPYAEPFTFLAIRFALVVLVLAMWIAVTSAKMPTRTQMMHQMVVGSFLHVGYLGGIFFAISIGIEAGMSAVIVGLQPIGVAILARPFLGDRVRPVQWLGFVIGTLGVTLVVLRKLESGVGDWTGVFICIAALMSICISSLYQKKYCADAPFRSSALIQYTTASMILTALAFAFETREVTWSTEFISVMAWLVLALSIGAVSLLYGLIQRGAAANVASLFFLVPPTAVLMGWLMFDELVGLIELAGMALAAFGVWIVNRK